MYRSVVCTEAWAKEKLNLFQFAPTTMAQACASAAKVVGCQIAYAGLPGAPLHCVPDYVGCHASFLSYSPLQNPPECFSLTHSRMSEPGIEKQYFLKRSRDPAGAGAAAGPAVRSRRSQWTQRRT